MNARELFKKEASLPVAAKGKRDIDSVGGKLSMSGSRCTMRFRPDFL